jgi:hypothetical protein
MTDAFLFLVFIYLYLFIYLYFIYVLLLCKLMTNTISQTFFYLTGSMDL